MISIMMNNYRENEFAQYHPLVNFIYFSSVIIITMFSMNPLFLFMTFTTSFIYSILLYSKEVIKRNLLLIIPIMIFTMIINPLLNHRGITVLFYLNDNAITLEAILYGLAACTLLVSSIIWFSCVNKVFTPDKMIYIFGKIMPILALMSSMCMRFVPLLLLRFKDISFGQVCLGRGKKDKIRSYIKSFTKRLSILISWSLESSIETSMSMESRGYGLKDRTFFHNYIFSRRDVLTLSIIVVLDIFILLGMYYGVNNIVYYPEIILENISLIYVISSISYGILLVLPLFINTWGEISWKIYYLKM